MTSYGPPKRRFFCYSATEQVEGPFELVELAGLLRAREIMPETLTAAEGEESWLPFKDRPEFHFAHEIPSDAIVRHVQEKAAAESKGFAPRQLLVFAWIMAPLLLYVLYRILRALLLYYLR